MERRKLLYVHGKLRKLAQDSIRGIACPMGWKTVYVETDDPNEHDDFIFFEKL